MRSLFRLNLFRNLYNKNSVAEDSPVTECGGEWRSVAEGGGVLRNVAECGGVWRSVACVACRWI